MNTAQLLIDAFTAGVASTYQASYDHVMSQLDPDVERALLGVVNGTLDRMKQRNCSAYDACSQVLPQLESTLSRRMAMAAAVLIVLNELPPGERLEALPVRV